MLRTTILKSRRRFLLDLAVAEASLPAGFERWPQLFSFSLFLVRRPAVLPEQASDHCFSGSGTVAFVFSDRLRLEVKPPPRWL